MFPENRGGYNQNRGGYHHNQPLAQDARGRGGQFSRDSGIHQQQAVPYPHSVPPRPRMDPFLPFRMPHGSMTPQMPLQHRQSSPFPPHGSSESILGQPPQLQVHSQGMPIGQSLHHVPPPSGEQASHGFVQSSLQTVTTQFMHAQYGDPHIAPPGGYDPTLYPHKSHQPSGQSRGAALRGREKSAAHSSEQTRQTGRLPQGYPQTVDPTARPFGVYEGSHVTAFQGFGDPSGALARAGSVMHQSASSAHGSFPYPPMFREQQADRQKQLASSTVTSLMTESPVTNRGRAEVLFSAPEAKRARIVTTEAVVTKPGDIHSSIASSVSVEPQSVSKRQQIIDASCKIAEQQVMAEFGRVELYFGIPVKDSLAAFVSMMSGMLPPPVVSRSATVSGLSTSTTEKSDTDCQSDIQVQIDKSTGLPLAKSVSPKQYDEADGAASTQENIDASVEIVRDGRRSLVVDPTAHEDNQSSSDPGGERDDNSHSLFKKRRTFKVFEQQKSEPGVGSSSVPQSQTAAEESEPQIIQSSQTPNLPSTGITQELSELVLEEGTQARQDESMKQSEQGIVEDETDTVTADKSKPKKVRGKGKKSSPKKKPETLTLQEEHVRVPVLRLRRESAAVYVAADTPERKKGFHPSGQEEQASVSGATGDSTESPRLKALLESSEGPTSEHGQPSILTRIQTSTVGTGRGQPVAGLPHEAPQYLSGAGISVESGQSGMDILLQACLQSALLGDPEGSPDNDRRHSQENK